MKHLLYILILLMLIAPVSAITYPKEYYDLGQKADINIDYILKLITQMANGNNMYDSKLQLSVFYELRRQTILMEKQNELLEEQNGLLRNTSGVNYHCGINKSMDGYDCIPMI